MSWRPSTRYSRQGLFGVFHALESERCDRILFILVWNAVRYSGRVEGGARLDSSSEGSATTLEFKLGQCKQPQAYMLHCIASVDWFCFWSFGFEARS